MENEEIKSNLEISRCLESSKEGNSSFEERLEKLLVFYRKSFIQHWSEEKYKWEAVKCFQDNWNVDAEHFQTVLANATSKTKNLLDAGTFFPRKMILDFANEQPERVREMFRTLFDETLDLSGRINHFKSESLAIQEEHNKNNPHDIWKNNFQNENSISTYLWLRYPNKYYIYKFSEAVKVERLLCDNPVIKRGEGISNLLAAKTLYDKIAEVIKEDKELIEIFKNSLGNDCYSDLEFRTLTVDFGFQVSRYYQDAVEDSETNEGDSSVHYWMYAPGERARYWEQFYNEGIIAIAWGEMGDLKQYPSLTSIKNKMRSVWGNDKSFKNDGLAVWQFANELKPNDVVFVKEGMYKIVGRGIVSSDYIYDKNRPNGYNHIRKINWTHKGEWTHPGNAVLKTLTDITVYKGYVENLNSLFDIAEEDEEKLQAINKPYSKSDFLNEVFMSEQRYETLVNLLERKSNLILQGAPGVGKTFAAKRLAYSIIGEIDKERIQMVQFHQSYSYEDFIMGYRPNENGFVKTPGIFYEFCKKAEIDNDNKYFFIIDEINRGNLSKIFGELLMLIEKDKRGQQLQLLYSKELFSIPSNLYIIGMMNTADRSLAIIDYALRRRFAFVEFEPAFESESISFENLKNSIENPNYPNLIDKIKELNRYISNDQSLGKGFRIGHSYFVPENGIEITDEWLSNVIEYEIIPLLEEYWFDNADEVNRWSNELRKCIN